MRAAPPVSPPAFPAAAPPPAAPPHPPLVFPAFSFVFSCLLCLRLMFIHLHQEHTSSVQKYKSKASLPHTPIQVNAKYPLSVFPASLSLVLSHLPPSLPSTVLGKRSFNVLVPGSLTLRGHGSSQESSARKGAGGLARCMPSGCALAGVSQMQRSQDRQAAGWSRQCLACQN